MMARGLRNSMGHQGAEAEPLAARRRLPADGGFQFEGMQEALALLDLLGASGGVADGVDEQQPGGERG
jgi:hypothetical protein